MTAKPTALAGRPKSKKKRAQILESAAEMFLAHGYERTSMDAVAKHSGVSKQTVYSHFKNKEALYSAVIEQKCISYQLQESSVYKDDMSLEEILAGFARKFIQLLTDQHVISMYNVVIGEAQQNLQIAELFHDAGPVHSIGLIQQLLKTHPSSLLNDEDAYAAAVDFFNLLKGDYHMRSLLHLPCEIEQGAIDKLSARTAKTVMMIITDAQQDM
ncbi:TetR/AcrR family transcriptional regulator [Glaciecola sp. XM2]|uniref:TetR/AcrR family transcriptional regulator n=1 Tax=Glaciecola sp. XM2 TaxID=1914931 RepID=UPI001BDE57B6|nr:TetR/AcrR family transcriptional regulator [Glaciecola sp. XM2]MBT1451625.1 TetR/AcrR family transcriptional regulator [Glaciecola sp. XM2]